MPQLKKSNLVDVKTNYTKPLKKTVQVTSPLAMRFLQLLEGYDRIIGLVDELWFAGHMTG